MEQTLRLDIRMVQTVDKHSNAPDSSPNVLERREEQHEDDSHDEYLDASAGHVEHKRLHGKGLGCGYGKVACSLFLQGYIGRYSFSCLLRRWLGLSQMKVVACCVGRTYVGRSWVEAVGLLW